MAGYDVVNKLPDSRQAEIAARRAQQRRTERLELNQESNQAVVNDGTETTVTEQPIVLNQDSTLLTDDLEAMAADGKTMINAVIIDADFDEITHSYEMAEELLTGAGIQFDSKLNSLSGDNLDETRQFYIDTAAANGINLTMIDANDELGDINTEIALETSRLLEQDVDVLSISLGSNESPETSDLDAATRANLNALADEGTLVYGSLNNDNSQNSLFDFSHENIFAVGSNSAQLNGVELAGSQETTSHSTSRITGNVINDMLNGNDLGTAATNGPTEVIPGLSLDGQSGIVDPLVGGGDTVAIDPNGNQVIVNDGQQQQQPFINNLFARLQEAFPQWAPILQAFGFTTA